MDDQPVGLDLNARNVSADEASVVNWLRLLEVVSNRAENQTLDLSGRHSVY
jgi:hypothetical protein